MKKSTFPGVPLTVVVAMLLATNLAVASPFTSTSITTVNGTVTGTHVSITGTYPILPETFTVSYTDQNNVAKTATGTTNSFGLLNVAISPKKGTTVTVKNTSEPTVPAGTFVADAFQPGQNTAVSAFAFNPTSTITVGGNTFNVSGGFTAVQTTVDYNPSSPTYGLETGYLTNVHLQATGSGGTIDFLNISTPQTADNLAAYWQQVVDQENPVGIPIDTDYTFSGDIMFNSILTPFTAVYTGTATFLDDGSTLDQGTLAMDTNIGPITGFLSASAFPELVPTPEPASLTLMGISLAGAIFLCRKKMNDLY